MFTGVVHLLEWFCLTALILVSIAIDYLMLFLLIYFFFLLMIAALCFVAKMLRASLLILQTICLNVLRRAIVLGSIERQIEVSCKIFEQNDKSLWKLVNI